MTTTDYVYFRCSHRAHDKITQRLGVRPLWSYSVRYDGLYVVTSEQWQQVATIKGVRKGRRTPYHSNPS